MNGNNIFETLKGYIPDYYVEMLEDVFQHFPSERRAALKKALESLQLESRQMKDLFKFIKNEYNGLLVEEAPSIVVVGPPNTGKSTLVNAIIGRRSARVSPVPGTTVSADSYEHPVFKVIDTPGFGDVFQNRPTNLVQEVLKEASVIVLVFDASLELSQISVDLYNQMQSYGKPVVVVLNKIDLVLRKDRLLLTSNASKMLGIDVIAISARYGKSIEKLLKVLAALNPAVLFGLSKALPAFRQTFAGVVVKRSVMKAASITSIPIPVADIIPLVGIQAGMVLKIARLYGENISWERAKELVTTLGGGMLFRTLFRQLAKVLPGPGLALNIAVASGGTYALGMAAKYYFEKHMNVTVSELKKKFVSYFRDFKTKYPRQVEEIGYS